MKLSKSLSVLLSLSLALFFLTAAIAFPILFRPFYYFQADALNLPEQLGLEESVIHEAYDEVMDFTARLSARGNCAGLRKVRHILQTAAYYSAWIFYCLLYLQYCLFYLQFCTAAASGFIIF